MPSKVVQNPYGKLAPVGPLRVEPNKRKGIKIGLKKTFKFSFKKTFGSLIYSRLWSEVSLHPWRVARFP